MPGPTLAYDETAYVQALKAVREFVAATLLRPQGKDAAPSPRAWP